MKLWIEGNNRFLSRSWFRLLTFIPVYSLVCFFLAPESPIGDEGRYLQFADNLLSGFYSPEYPDVDLWNGPGYPIFLAFLKLMNPSLTAIRLANCLLMYFALILAYQSLIKYVTPKVAFPVTVFLGVYYPIFEMLPRILTECMAWFLVSLVCYTYLHSFSVKGFRSKLYGFFCSLSIAFLAMTKVIFGYVILLMIFTSLTFALLKPYRNYAIRSAVIYLVAILLCLPWLSYTHRLTGIYFY
jgi:hypothetical protein